jgi:hypothetical protein
MKEARKRADLDKQLSILVEEADKLGKSVNAMESDQDEYGSPKPNGIVTSESKPSSATEMERFAEQAQSFKPKGNTLETADVC